MARVSYFLFKNLIYTVLLILGISVVFCTFFPTKGHAKSNVCVSFFLDDKEALIQGAQLENFVRSNQGWFEVVVPTENGFVYHQVQDWKQVETLFQSMPPEQRKFAQNLLQKSNAEYKSVVAFFRPIAVRFKATFKARIKNLISLRTKIIEKAKSFSKTGRFYTKDDISDLIGLRFIVPIDSPLLEVKSDKNKWAEYLGVRPEQIAQVTFKGSEEDIQFGKYYRAIHIDVNTGSGSRVEIQVMTKTVSYWHTWDHNRVYKSTAVNEAYKQVLKNYSVAWIRLIRALEDLKTNKDSLVELNNLLTEYDLILNPRDPLGIQSFDEQLSTKLGVQEHDRFFYASSKKVMQDLALLWKKALR